MDGPLLHFETSDSFPFRLPPISESRGWGIRLASGDRISSGCRRWSGDVESEPGSPTQMREVAALILLNRSLSGTRQKL